METTQLIPAGIKAQIKTDLAGLLSYGKVTITNAIERENAGHAIVTLKRTYNEYEAKRKDLKEPHLDNWRKVDDYFRDPLAAFKAAINELNQGVYAFDEARRIEVEKEQKRLEDERLAECKRLADIQDAKLREEERLREEAAALAKAAEDAKTATERDALIEKANTAERVADVAGAEAVDAAQAGARAADQSTVVLQGYKKPKGQTVKKLYKVEILDPVAFIRWAVANQKFHWLEIKDALVNKEVTANEGQWSAPGVRVVEDVRFYNKVRLVV
ncbi:hypothetical protein CCP3SC15_380006 [Gammaproteobacteria bacterium]